MIKNKLLDILAYFQKNKRKWILMTVDKLFFEAQTDRYFLILKASGKYRNETVFITIGNMFDESVLTNLFFKNESTKKMFQKLGIGIKKIRILKKVNSEDSAECILKIGMAIRRIKISTVDAVRMASEYNKNIEVPQDIVKADKFDLAEYSNMYSRVYNNIFSTKFIERDFYNSNEVIM